MLISFLEGRSPGEAFVDDVDNPTAFIAIIDFYRFGFVGGAPDAAWLADAIAQLRAQQSVLLVGPAHATVPAADRTLSRIEFLHPDPTRQPPPPPLPDGYHFRAIDADLLARCEWRDDMIMGYGSAERLLSEGFGVCLMHGDEIACETYALFPAEGHYEIGVVTHEAYRGKGFAYATCLRLCEECAQRGLETTWSCDLDNAGSQATARKLGYTIERPYRLLYYPRQD
jgi:RimJ/RimL family protein N-acetyltransferase